MRLRRTARNDAAIVRSAWLKTCATGFLCRISTISEERTALCADPRAALRRFCMSVGRYRGLATMNLGEDEAEFLHLDYAQGGTLYVPVAQLHWITRYSGQAPEH